ncbi:SIR2 family protein [Prosthecobacter debontii]|nr:SIR2 family protein [Prosthecobacter debontii]
MPDSALHSDLDYISRYLSQGKAVVVVGAGFSKNAQPKLRRDGATAMTVKMPDWNELVRRMAEELHPRDPAALERCLNSGHLQVAQQYEANEGPEALKSFIKQALHAVRVEPGELHHQLLKLPWADVLTFNYDSLLEEAALDFQPPQYTTIYSQANLLGASRPRIIKLHGSMPDGPFVITEEHFRTYAQDRPAFVNTVRQLMIENTLVLVGFSGTDPNFKLIHGWVRDLFEADIHRVYMCHVNGFSLPEARLFRKTYKIHLINLAELFNPGTQVSYPENLERLFTELQTRCKIKVASLPMPDMPQWPGEVPWHFIAPDELEKQSSDGLIQINDLLGEWRRQRESYPGWLVAPLDIRRQITQYTDFWPHPLATKMAEGTAPSEVELAILQELKWRWDVSLDIIHYSWARWVEAAVQRAGDAKALPEHSRRALRDLRLLLLQIHRENMNEVNFTLILETFRAERENDAGLDAWLLHEECLLAFYCLDFDRFEPALERFVSVTAPSLRHALRKIGWLAEQGKIDGVKKLADIVIKDLVRQVDETQKDILKLSLEGWALLFHQITYQMSMPDVAAGIPNHRDRRRELKRVECNPWDRIEELRSAIALATPRTPKKPERAGFDPGTSTHTISLFPQGMGQEEILAFQYLRLFDEVGLPHHPGILNMGGPTMVKAAQMLMPIAFKRAVATRIRNTDKTLQEELGRGTVLRLRAEDADWLISLCLRGLAQMLPRLQENLGALRSHYAGRGAPYLWDLASRLTLRMTTIQLDEFFNLLCQFHEHPGIHAEFMTWRSWGEGLRRVLFSGTQDQLSVWLPVLARIPFGPSAHGENPWITLPFEPFTAVEQAHISDHHIGFTLEEENLQSWLNGLRSPQAGRRCAAFNRLSYLSQTSAWNPAWSEAFEQALWTHKNSDGLPACNPGPSRVFLGLPERISENARRHLKAHLLRDAIPPVSETASDGTTKYSGGNAKHYLQELVILASWPWQPPEERAFGITWETAEASQILHRALEWWDASQRYILEELLNGKSEWERPRELLQVFEQGLCCVLAHLSSGAGQADIDRLMKVAADMSAAGFQVPRLEVASFMTDRRDNMQRHDLLVALITGELLSLDEERVASAAYAVRLWMEWPEAEGGRVSNVPQQLLTLLVNRVRFRMEPGLDDVLSVCGRLAISENCPFGTSHLQALEDGLRFLLHETAFSTAKESGWEPADEEHDVLMCKLRVESALLAKSLARLHDKGGEPRPEIVTTWLDTAAKDPLPEVRRVLWGMEPTSVTTAA